MKFWSRPNVRHVRLSVFISQGEVIRRFTRNARNYGRLVFPQIIKEIDHDIKNTVFSYIPNTAETSFFGMVKEAQNYLNKKKEEQILSIGSSITSEQLHEILEVRPRIEKVAIKDAKLRTFITQDDSRDDLVAHVYDISYGSVKQGDNLVIIDDSIVRKDHTKKEQYYVFWTVSHQRKLLWFHQRLK